MTTNAAPATPAMAQALKDLEQALKATSSQRTQKYAR